MSKELSKKQIILYSILILTFFISINLTSRFSPSIGVNNEVSFQSKAEEYLMKNRGVAKLICRDEIKKQLKTPNEASFSREGVEYTGELNSEARVGGEVTSQNSFGTNLTNLYVCNLRWDGESYLLLDAKILK